MICGGSSSSETNQAVLHFPHRQAVGREGRVCSNGEVSWPARSSPKEWTCTAREADLDFLQGRAGQDEQGVNFAPFSVSNFENFSFPGESAWSEEAKEVVEKLTFGNILQAQVYGYAFPGVPLIYLYTVVNNEVSLASEFVHSVETG